MLYEFVITLKYNNHNDVFNNIKSRGGVYGFYSFMYARSPC